MVKSKYKSMRILFVVLVILTLAAPSAFAADDFWSTVQSSVPAGILPSSFWYWLDVSAERVRAFLTLSKEAKVNYLLSIADEKISEAQKMVENDLPDDATIALEQYDYDIARAQQIFADAIEDGKTFAQETQTRLEEAILLHEKMVKLSILQIPDVAMSGMNTIYDTVSDWFNQLLTHLKWKRAQIEVKQSALTD
jgi:hypothetical protein